MARKTKCFFCGIRTTNMKYHLNRCRHFKKIPDDVYFHNIEPQVRYNNLNKALEKFMKKQFKLFRSFGNNFYKKIFYIDKFNSYYEKLNNKLGYFLEYFDAFSCEKMSGIQIRMKLHEYKSFCVDYKLETKKAVTRNIINTNFFPEKDINYTLKKRFRNIVMKDLKLHFEIKKIKRFLKFQENIEKLMNL